jgi:hypothetical protein
MIVCDCTDSLRRALAGEHRLPACSCRQPCRQHFDTHGFELRWSDPSRQAAETYRLAACAPQKSVTARSIRNLPRFGRTLRQHPIKCVIQIGQCSSFDRIVMTGAAQFDDAFFSRVCLDDELVKTGRHDLVFFSQ